MIRSICVYCSSSNHVDPQYFAVAEEAGRLLGARGDTLVYGGGKVGLMGAIAEAVHAHGGRVVGVIPDALKGREGVAYETADHLITTRTMQKRKAIMFSRAEAFMVLPGGFGTLEEFFEVLTLRQLSYHDLPIALVNTAGFFDPLLDLFEHLYRERFAASSHRRLYHVAATPADALAHIDAYLDEHGARGFGSGV